MPAYYGGGKNEAVDITERKITHKFKIKKEHTFPTPGIIKEILKMLTKVKYNKKINNLYLMIH